MEITKLKPQPFWTYFSEITNIPRPSGKEDKIINYLKAFAQQQKLEYKTDKAGNLLIKKSATIGKENLKTLVLQSHVDMVCEKNNDVVFNFDTDAIQPYIDGEWVKAKGTTLGADDGVGVAAQLAILASENIKHGPIECLFTVSEETGLSGAIDMDANLISGEILINLDSEEEGEATIGCAGGILTKIHLPIQFEPFPVNHKTYKITVKGLRGGHSGEDIKHGYGNSIKILNRFLWNSIKKYHIRISDLKGGNLHNAIPREAYGIIAIPLHNIDTLIKYCNDFAEIIKKEYELNEKGLTINIEPCEGTNRVLRETDTLKLTNSLYACPHGVIAMSKEIQGLVETSTNLASIHFENNIAVILTSQRSSINSSKIDIANMIESVFLMVGATIEHSGGYPGWKPNLNSKILTITKEAYKKLFNNEIHIKAIHAGLECGLFLEKYPYMDMISIGPTVECVHSPDERLHIPSVEKFWNLLIEIIENIPSK